MSSVTQFPFYVRHDRFGGSGMLLSVGLLRRLNYDFFVKVSGVIQPNEFPPSLCTKDMSITFCIFLYYND